MYQRLYLVRDWRFGGMAQLSHGLGSVSQYAD
jgi:hypothetical protein